MVHWVLIGDELALFSIRPSFDMEDVTNCFQNQAGFLDVTNYVRDQAGFLDHSVLILGLCTANERRRYFVTTSLIGWAQT